MFTSEPTSPVIDGNAAMAAQESNTSTLSATIAPTSNGTATSGLPQGGGSSQNQASSTGYVDPEGKFTEGWLDRLKGFDDAKQILGQFKDMDGVFKTLVSQQRLLGKKADAVIVPNEKSSPEEWQEFNKRIGVPDSPDGYKHIKPAHQLPESDWNEQIATKLGEVAHKNGIPPKAWQSVLDTLTEYASLQNESEQQAKIQQLETERKTLAEEWGDKFDINLSKAKRLVQVGGGDVNDPAFASSGVVKMLARIADTLSDDRLVSSDSAATMMVGKARAMDIMKNPQNPLHQRYKSGDREIANLVTDLLK
jgi:hypothetical protein